MKLTAWVALGLATVLALSVSGVALAQREKAVVLDLGPVEPTPPPTPRHADRKRLVSTITVQNSIERDSIISFEVADMADEGEERIRLFAMKTYTLSDDELAEVPAARALADDIVRRIRDLEREMLRYSDMVGPPEERRPLAE